MTCFTPVDKNNCFSNVYIREVVRSEIQKVAECFEGDSAYAVAVKNGYVGTEDDWLASLGGTITDIKAISLEAGSAPSATLGGTPRNRVINLGIPKGEKGKEGTQGIPGPTGLSAYDVAVANGFNGTKTDWLLTIKGAKGDVGPEGPKGEEGKSTYELSVDYGYSGSEREWLSGLINDTELMSNLNADLLSIDQAANGDINTTVVTRTGETYPSAKKAISEGIVALFENGGLPATPSATKALMTASALVDGDYALVTDGAADNGLYVKTAGAWVKSGYDPTELANTYTDNKVKGVTNNFKTKALMIASTLPDDSYAMVTEEVDNLGLYIKKDSEWVLSEYNFQNGSGDSVGFGEVSSKLTEPYEVLDLSRDITKNTKVSTTTLTESYSALINLSHVIPVTKGDIFIVKRGFTTSMSNSASTILYNEQNEAVQSFGALPISSSTFLQGSSDIQKNLPDSALMFDIDDSILALDYLTTEIVQIPLDGFIRVSFVDSNDSSDLVRKEKDFAVKVYKTTVKDVVNSKKVLLNKGTFDNLKDHIKLPDIDFSERLTEGNPIGFWVPQAIIVGSPIIKQNGIDTGYSTPIPIKKGQFIHIHSQSRGGKYPFIADSSDMVLEVINPLHKEYGSAFLGMPVVVVNYVAQSDGFLYIPSNNRGLLSCFYAITEEKIKEEVEYIKDGQKLEFYKYTGTSKPADRNGIYTTTRHTAGPFNSLYTSNSYESTANTITDLSGGRFALVRSKLYLLKKGDVLRYSSKTNDPNLITVSSTKPNEDGEYPSIKVFDTRAVTLEGIWSNAPEVESLGNSDTFFNEAQDCEVFYCNEESDVYVSFNLPSPVYTLYNTFKQTQEYDIEVWDKDAYIKYRDANITSLTTPSHFGFGTNYYQDYGSIRVTHTWTNPVLVFKGELISYTNSPRHAQAIYNLEKPKNGFETVAPFVSTSGVNSGHSKYNPEDPLSYSVSQSLVKETGFFTMFVPSFDAETTEYTKENEIFPHDALNIKVFDFKSSNLKKDYPLIEYPGNIGHDFEDLNYVKHSFTPATVVKAAFVKKGRSYLLSSWLDLIFAGFKPISEIGSNTNFWRIYSRDEDGVITPQTAVSNYMNTSNSTGYFEAPEDGLIILRSSGFSSSSILFDETNRFDIEELSQEEVERDFTLSDKPTITVPLTPALNFNIYGLLARHMDTELPAIVQIRDSDRVLCTLNAIIANQGQSSAGNYQQNINIEFFTPDWSDSITVKFGDNLGLDQYVLKSYYRTDRPHARESVSTDLWSEMRRVGSVTNSALPKEVMDDRSIGYYRYNARCTNKGFPTTVYMGGEFFGCHTIRGKKDRRQFAMSKNNPNHILMQADRQLADFKWDVLSLNNFELRNPKVSGYDEGDPTLPAGNEVLSTKLEDLFSWCREATTYGSNTIEGYQEVFDKNSIIDYSIFMAAARHWDGSMNNFFFGTWDGGTQWHVYLYDADQTWGGYAAGGFPQTPYNNVMHEHGGLFSKLYANPNTFKDIKVRYAELRDSGILDIAWVRDRFRHYTSWMNSDQREINDYMWEAEPNHEQTVEYSLSWADRHFRYMDALHEYTPEDSLGVFLLNTSIVTPNNTKNFRVTLPNVTPGDVLNIEVGDLNEGLQMTYVIQEGGEVVVSFLNTTEENITQNSYIRFFKK